MSWQGRKVPSEYLLYLVIYALVLGGAYWAGYRMQIPYHYFQYLDRAELSQHLGRSLLYLHAQPPLPNLILGLALKLESVTAIRPQTSLFILQALQGAIIVLSLAYLARTLIRPRLVRAAAVLLWLVNPVVYSFIYLYFYPLHETFILCLLAVFAYRYLCSHQLSDLAFVGGLLVALTYTRSLFHFVWPFLVLVFLLLFVRRRFAMPAERLIAPLGIALLSALLLLAWPLKNYWQFGFFGSSSWRGYNFAQGLPTTLPPVTSVFSAVGVPEEFASIPVLAEPAKGGGAANWNFYPIIAYAQQREAEALARVRRQPRLLYDKVKRNYLQGYASFGLRNPYEGTLDKRSTDTPLRFTWARLYERVVFNYHGDDIRSDYLNGFTFYFPVFLVLAIRKLLRRDVRGTPEGGVAAVMMFAIVWVLLMVLFVDGMEGNRIRFPTGPFLLVLTGWLLSGPSISKNSRPVT